MKKLLKLSLALTMVLFLSACSAVAAENKADYSDRTLTGKITSINGNTLTLQIGKLKQDDSAMDGQMDQFGQGVMASDGQLPTDGEMPEMGQFPMMEEGQMPDFENGEMPQLAQGQFPTDGEMPQSGSGFPPFGQGQMNENDGETSQFPEGDTAQGNFPQMNGMGPKMGRRGDMSQMPQSDGTAPSFEQGELPEMGDGQMPDMGQFPTTEEGQIPDFENGEMPQFGQGQFSADGQMSQMNEGQMPMMGMGQGMNGQMSGSYTFKEGNETVTIDIGNVSVSLADGTTGSASDLKVGDVVSIIVDQNNEVASVKVFTVNNEEE